MYKLARIARTLLHLDDGPLGDGVPHARHIHHDRRAYARAGASTHTVTSPATPHPPHGRRRAPPKRRAPRGARRTGFRRDAMTARGTSTATARRADTCPTPRANEHARTLAAAATAAPRPTAATLADAWITCDARRASMCGGNGHVILRKWIRERAFHGGGAPAGGTCLQVRAGPPPVDCRPSRLESRSTRARGGLRSSA